MTDTAEPARRLPTLTSVRHSSWRSVLRVLPEGAMRRRPSDLARVLTATVGVAVLAAAAQRYSSLEQATTDVAQALPDGIGWLFRGLARAGALSTIALVALAAVVARRVRLAASLLAAGISAWGIATVLANIITTGSTTTPAGSAGSGDLPDYPAIGLATLAAVTLAAKPFLTRPMRPLITVSIGAVALSLLYTGDGVTTGVVGAVVLGWGTAAAAHLAFGSPAGLPPRSQIRDALATIGVEVDDLALAPTQGWGESTYLATDAAGQALRIAVVGRDATDAQLLTKVWHSLWYRETGTVLTLTRTQQIEHRAYLLLVADRAGVAAPEVVAAAVAGRHSDALLVLEDAGGTTLDVIDVERVTDAVLDDLWTNLHRLHAASMAHNDLAPATLEVGADGTTAFVDLQAATTSTLADTRNSDRVALLVSTAQVVGDDRALDAARRALGTEGMATLLPVLQVAALPTRLRRALPDEKRRVAALRDAVATASGTDAPELASLRRVSVADVAMAAATIFGVYLLFGELADVDFATIVDEAQWEWVAVTFVFSQLPQLGGAIATFGSVARPLPLKPTLLLQYANNFTGMIGGTVANTALIVRFFQKQGMTPGTAVSSGMLVSAAAGVTQVVLVILGLVVTGASFHVPSSSDSTSDSGQLLVTGIVLVGVVSGVVLIVPRMRRRIGSLVVPQLRAAKANLMEVLKTPKKGLQLFGGNVISQVFFAMTLGAALHAYGESLPLGQLIVINSLASVLGGIAPVPGGMGVIEAGLIGGFTAAGIPQDQAVAATFTARLFTAYLPPIWGWGALQWMRRADLA